MQVQLYEFLKLPCFVVMISEASAHEGYILFTSKYKYSTQVPAGEAELSKLTHLTNSVPGLILDTSFKVATLKVRPT